MNNKNLLSLVVIIFFASSAFAADLTKLEVTLSDDAYHYRYFRDGQHDVNYIEWWYFNFFDALQDVQLILSYGIADPDNLSGGAGQTTLTAVAFTPQGIAHETDVFSAETFSACYDEANVTIGANFIEVIDSDTYHIVGSVGDGRICWDLIYGRQAESWFGGDRIQVGLFPWEQMSWLVYMPRAYVSGEITVDGQLHVLSDIPGYHDHNWGEWIPCTVMFNWAQYSEPGLALELGDFMWKGIGILSMEFQNHRTTFLREQYSLIHTRWKFDPENRKFYPRVTWVFAENETELLLLRMQALDTVPLVMAAPSPFLPFVIIYEQTAHYSGWLWGKNGHGEWQLLEHFDGFGFKEYTTHAHCAGW